LAHGSLPFAALAEADLQLANRRQPIPIRSSEGLKMAVRSNIVETKIAAFVARQPRRYQIEQKYRSR
jgi:hypothetical protein